MKRSKLRLCQLVSINSRVIIPEKFTLHVQLILDIELIFIFRVFSFYLSLRTNIKPDLIRGQFISSCNLFSPKSEIYRQYRLDFTTCQTCVNSANSRMRKLIDSEYPLSSSALFEFQGRAFVCRTSFESRARRAAVGKFRTKSDFQVGKSLPSSR